LPGKTPVPRAGHIHYASFMPMVLDGRRGSGPLGEGTGDGPRNGWYNSPKERKQRLECSVVERERLEATDRVCPWCASTEVRLIQRGYARLTDERDQYLICDTCHKTTFLIVAKTAREMRLGRYKPGDIYQDRTQNTRYTISRVLRSGSNEFLVYLKPLHERAGVVL
jgi:hypothetical protein